MKKLIIVAAAGVVGYVLAEKYGRTNASTFTSPQTFGSEPEPTHVPSIVPDLTVVPEPVENTTSQADAFDETATADVAAEVPDLDAPIDTIEETEALEAPLESTDEPGEDSATDSVEDLAEEPVEIELDSESDSVLQDESVSAPEPDVIDESVLIRGFEESIVEDEPSAAVVEDETESAPADDEEIVESLSKESLESWESNWGDDMPFIETDGESTPESQA